MKKIRKHDNREHDNREHDYRETTNSTASKKKDAKTPTWYQNYKNLNSWRLTPVSDAFIEKLCEKILEHFDNPKNKTIHVIPFLHSLGISYQVFQQEWLPRYENLRGVYDYAKEKIGVLREDLAIYKKYNCSPQTLHFTMHHYHPLWKKTVEDDNDASTVKYVVLEKYPETAIVPKYVSEHLEGGRIKYEDKSRNTDKT